MKRPYSEGDWFAVPLGNGRFAVGRVTRGTHKAIEGAFFGPGCDTLAEARELAGSSCAVPLWGGRFSDRALVQHRWPLLDKRESAGEKASAATGLVASPGLVERVLAETLGGASHDRARLSVRDVRFACDLRIPERQTHARVQWRAPLSPDDLASVAGDVIASGCTSVRLHQTAAWQANELATWTSIETLELESQYLPENLAAFPSVLELRLDGVPRDPQALIASFPGLRVLRIRARGGTLDATLLLGAEHLRTLDLHGTALTAAASLVDLRELEVLSVRESSTDDTDAMLRLPISILRLDRVVPIRSIEALRGNAALRVLSFAGLLDLDDLHPIASLERLESLDLRGLWQFGVGDVAFVESMPSLQRLNVDIGGRRKNVEIYKRRPLALPLPFYEG